MSSIGSTTNKSVVPNLRSTTAWLLNLAPRRPSSPDPRQHRLASAPARAAQVALARSGRPRRVRGDRVHPPKRLDFVLAAKKPHRNGVPHWRPRPEKLPHIRTSRRRRPATRSPRCRARAARSSVCRDNPRDAGTAEFQEAPAGMARRSAIRLETPGRCRSQNSPRRPPAATSDRRPRPSANRRSSLAELSTTIKWSQTRSNRQTSRPMSRAARVCDERIALLEEYAIAQFLCAVKFAARGREPYLQRPRRRQHPGPARVGPPSITDRGTGPSAPTRVRLPSSRAIDAPDSISQVCRQSISTARNYDDETTMPPSGTAGSADGRGQRPAR